MTIEWSKFKLDNQHSISRRICEALNWAADHRPGECVDYRILTKVVMGYTRTPIADSADVKRIRTCKTGANKQLHRLYNRAIIVERDVGIRSSVDDTDKAAHVLVRKHARVRSSVKSFEETANSIDVKKIPNTPANKEIRDFAVQSIKYLLPVFQSPDFQKRMLPPALDASAPKEEDVSAPPARPVVALRKVKG